MLKIFLSLSLGLAAIASTYLLLINTRKAELSYALPPPPLHGDPMNQCYPTTFHPPQEVRYVEAESGVRYYEAIASTKDTASDPSDSFVTSYATLYLRTAGKDTCKWLNRNDLQSGRLKFMPQGVAIALAKLRYSEVLNQCVAGLPKGTEAITCTQQLEQSINLPPDWESDKIDYLFPDDAQALNELGVQTDQVLIVKSINELEHRQKLERGAKDENGRRHSRGHPPQVSRVLPSGSGKPASPSSS